MKTSMGVSPAGAGTVSDSQQTVFPGFSVQVSATPNEGYEFSHWETSDEQLSLPSQPTVTFTPTGSMFITAVFSQLYPCEENGVFAPLLKDLRIQETEKQGIPGGLSGAGRYGNRDHNGMDFAAPTGTPLFSMVGGHIYNNFLVTEQPNRIPDPEEEGRYIYPQWYTGDGNNAGNRIAIEFGDYLLVYWHLDADNPLAINPRTGNPWAPGDEVFAGDLIGYLGLTGNAIWGSPHLHLGVRRRSDMEWVNPQGVFPSFFSDINLTTGAVTIPCP